MTVLVLGGYGAVGRRIVDTLRADGVATVSAGRDPARADLAVDLRDHSVYMEALNGVAVVVNASGSEDVDLARISAGRDIPFVDISATSSYTQALNEVRGPVLLGVGIAPGLSGILAREAFSENSTGVDVAIGLGAGERHGAAATEWTYGLLGTRFDDPDGSSVKNFTAGKKFDFPSESGYRRFASLRADFADQHRLTEELAVPVRTYLRLDSRLMTVGLAAMTHAPWLSRFTPSVMPGGDRWAIVARDHAGMQAWATGREQSTATAVIGAWSGRALLEGRIEISAPTWLHGAVSLRDLSEELQAAGIMTSPGASGI